jgi:predicted esterase
MESTSFRSLQSRLFELYTNGDYRKALDLALDSEHHFPDQEGRIGFWLGCLYSRLGELDSAVRVLRTKMARGHWWAEERMLGDEDLAPLQDLPEFRSIIAECAARRREAQKSARPDLLVRVPPGAAPIAGYPMLIALHGRDGRADAFAPYWEESTAQGWMLSVPTSSLILSPDGFGWDDQETAERDVAWARDRTCAMHRVDRNRMVLAGFSQGGALAIRMALKGDVVPARGFLVVAPSSLREPSEVVSGWLGSAARRGVRGWIFTGERDYARPQSVELRDRLVASGVACELTIQPNVGHEFPSDFPTRLVSALESSIS